MAAMSTSLRAVGVGSDHIHTEAFGASAAPGAAAVAVHPPTGAPGDGPTVTFSRSGLAVPFSDDYANLLEFAEACDVPVRWSCRTGVCHTCVAPLVAGSVRYAPEPLKLPEAGDVLLCCAVPELDIVLDA